VPQCWVYEFLSVASHVPASLIYTVRFLRASLYACDSARYQLLLLRSPSPLRAKPPAVMASACAQISVSVAAPSPLSSSSSSSSSCCGSSSSCSFDLRRRRSCGGRSCAGLGAHFRVSRVYSRCRRCCCFRCFSCAAPAAVAKRFWMSPHRSSGPLATGTRRCYTCLEDGRLNCCFLFFFLLFYLLRRDMLCIALDRRRMLMMVLLIVR
jgi:hypothetical protein